MRRICVTSLKRNILIGLLMAAVFAVILAVFVWMLGVEADHFDANAQKGTPVSVAETEGYDVFNAAGICEVGLCGVPRIEGRDVYIYLTNPESNTVAIKIEFYTPLMVQQENGSYEAVPDVLLGGTDFIRPGEYVEIARLKKALKDDRTNVMMKISTLDEAEGRSVGFFYVNTVFEKAN